MVKPRPTPVKSIIAQLTSGHGAQRLTPALRAIEILDIPTRGVLKGQRAFVKTILPKIKYHNSHLDIVTNFIEGPPKKKGKEIALEDVESPPTKILSDPIIQLHFHELPSQALPMANKSAVEITREMLTLIQKSLGREPEPETELAGATTLSEETLSEGTLSEDEILAENVVEESQDKNTAIVQETQEKETATL